MPAPHAALTPCAAARLLQVLQELDVYDDATQPPSQHTLAKFRRCYGALLRRDARAERLGLRER
jgi:hypothetical protein